MVFLARTGKLYIGNRTSSNYIFRDNCVVEKMSNSDVASLYETFLSLKEQIESNVQRAIADAEAEGYEPQDLIDKTVAIELLKGYNLATSDFETIKDEIGYSLPTRLIDLTGNLSKQKLFAQMQLCIVKINKILGALEVAKDKF